MATPDGLQDQMLGILVAKEAVGSRALFLFLLGFEIGEVKIWCTPSDLGK